MKPRSGLIALTSLALLTAGVGSALAAEGSGTATDGKALLEKNCGRCHSLEATGESPLKGAPPLREVYLRYPIEQLEEGFAEGMGSRHRACLRSNFRLSRFPGS
jgi:mono/diheme cytochrome c family protein